MLSVVFALQVYPGDVFAAIELATLIADLTATPRPDTEFWVVYRRDTPKTHIQFLSDTLFRASKTVLCIEAPNHGEGFPEGCNMLWNSTMLVAASLRRNGTTKAEGILTFEPDCVPLSRDWMDALSREWDVLGKEVIGSLVPGNPPHINGNAMFGIDLLHRFPELGRYGYGQAWDTQHAELLVRIGAPTDLIVQRYNSTHVRREELFSTRTQGRAPVLLHGVKDGSARSAVRAQLIS